MARKVDASVRRVWLIYFGVDLGATAMIDKALDAAQRMKLDVVPKGVLDVSELGRVLREVRGGDAVLVPEGSNPELVIAIIEQSLVSRSPAVFGTRSGSRRSGCSRKERSELASGGSTSRSSYTPATRSRLSRARSTA